VKTEMENDSLDSAIGTTSNTKTKAMTSFGQSIESLNKNKNEGNPDQSIKPGT